jgi:hypothetical protein
MKTKLRLLAFLGLLLLLLPIVYIPTGAVKALLVIIGAAVIYVAWRIAISYRRVLAATRHTTETSRSALE